MEKCSFLENSCVYAEGIHPTTDKLIALQNAPEPTSVLDLQSYLVMVNYYHNFSKNLGTVLAPLHKLLQNKYYNNNNIKSVLGSSNLDIKTLNQLQLRSR